jgi:hypothetical protein
MKFQNYSEDDVLAREETVRMQYGDDMIAGLKAHALLAGFSVDRYVEDLLDKAGEIAAMEAMVPPGDDDAGFAEFSAEVDEWARHEIARYKTMYGPESWYPHFTARDLDDEDAT